MKKDKTHLSFFFGKTVSHFKKREGFFLKKQGDVCIMALKGL